MLGSKTILPKTLAPTCTPGKAFGNSMGAALLRFASSAAVCSDYERCCKKKVVQTWADSCVNCYLLSKGSRFVPLVKTLPLVPAPSLRNIVSSHNNNDDLTLFNYIAVVVGNWKLELVQKFCQSRSPSRSNDCICSVQSLQC